MPYFQGLDGLCLALSRTLWILSHLLPWEDQHGVSMARHKKLRIAKPALHSQSRKGTWPNVFETCEFRRKRRERDKHRDLGFWPLYCIFQWRLHIPETTPQDGGMGGVMESRRNHFWAKLTSRSNGEGEDLSVALPFQIQVAVRAENQTILIFTHKEVCI